MISKFHISKHGQCGVSVTGLELDDQYIPEEYMLLSKYNYKHSETVTLNLLLKLDALGKIDQKISQYEIIDHENICNDISIFNMPKDGVYKIIHCIIPTDKWLDTTSADPSAVPSNIIYYNGKDFIYQKNIVSLDNFADLIDLEDSTIISSSKLTFNMCNMLNCYNKTNQFIFDGLLGGCTNNDIKSKEVNRDIIFMGLNVIKYNLERGDYFTAQRTLDRLTTCSDLCDSKMTKYNGCGCH
jgi:hypothetical protein